MTSEVLQKPVIDVSTKLIKVGERARKDLGDIAALAASIEGVGLLQPIGIDPNYRLIFGERRLRAFESLGREKIPARIVHVQSALEGEDLLQAISGSSWDASELDVIARVRLGEKIESALRARATLESIAKSEWINAARVSFKPGSRQACHVCGRFNGVAQAHHVAPLGIQHDMGVKHAIQDFVWLCPTHHAIAHTVISEHAKGEHTPFIDGVPPEDLDEIEKISKRGFDLILGALSVWRSER